ncbi:MAG: hypothetical protein U0521_13050 [Anaerolineae bacterium]
MSSPSSPPGCSGCWRSMQIVRCPRRYQPADSAEVRPVIDDDARPGDLGQRAEHQIDRRQIDQVAHSARLRTPSSLRCW